jgi:DNA-dependent protein kinase catalytic subunit
LRRLYALLRHPTTLKRLGGLTALYAALEPFAASAQAADIYILEAFGACLFSANLADADDSSIGTLEACQRAARRLLRIVKAHADILRRPRGGKVDRRGFATLSDLVENIVQVGPLH